MRERWRLVLAGVLALLVASFFIPWGPKVVERLSSGSTDGNGGADLPPDNLATLDMSGFNRTHVLARGADYPGFTFRAPQGSSLGPKVNMVRAGESGSVLVNVTPLDQMTTKESADIKAKLAGKSSVPSGYVVSRPWWGTVKEATQKNVVKSGELISSKSYQLYSATHFLAVSATWRTDDTASQGTAQTTAVAIIRTITPDG